MPGRVVIAKTENTSASAFPALGGVRATGLVRSRHVIDDASALESWVHEADSGAILEWSEPKTGHLLYVSKGKIEVDGAPVDAGQVVVVEHRATARLVVSKEGAVLVHFHESETQLALTTKAGGHVHIYNKEGSFTIWDEERHARHTVWADAHCPTCDLWLHKSEFQRPRPQSEPHMHNEDEIIFVVDGGTIVGQVHGPGTAIAVGAGTVYAFGVAEGGTTFINFRATNPFVKMTDRGKPVGEWISEYAFMRNEAAVPVIDPRAAARA